MDHSSALRAGLLLSLIGSIGVLAAFNARSFRQPENTQWLNGSLAQAFERHYDDLFPAKQLGVNLWAAVNYTLFHEGRRGVILGRNGWLYSDEEFNIEDGYEQRIREHLALISKVRRELEAAGVALVIAVVPEKTRVYPEFLATRTPSKAHESLHARLLKSLASTRVPTADLMLPLRQGKAFAPTYFRTDTHWTPWGAKLAAAHVANTARAAGLTRSSGIKYATRLQAVRAHRGDLVNFLPLAPFFEHLLPPHEQIHVMKTAMISTTASSRAASTLDLFSDDALPEVALVGTSYSANPLWNFSGYLTEALGEDVANYARQGTGPFLPMLSYLRSDDFLRKHPRLVIWEIPERSLLVTATANESAGTRQPAEQL